jgi:hypothetical protein
MQQRQRLAKIERGEDVKGGFGKAMTYKVLEHLFWEGLSEASSQTGRWRVLTAGKNFRRGDVCGWLRTQGSQNRSRPRVPQPIIGADPVTSHGFTQVANFILSKKNYR